MLFLSKSYVHSCTFSAKKLLIPVILLLTALNLQAQYAPGVDWKVIKSDNFDIIFPEELEEDAQRVANILEYSLEALQKTLKPRKFSRWPVVLTNRGAIPNGYVTITPKKSVWFGTPIAGTASDWYLDLASHETRHMVQFDYMNSGLLRLFYLLGGNNLLSTGIMLNFPNWFFEGDAVGTETLLSESGRGRDPDFEKALKAILLEDRQYSYYKAALGSYKDYIPNHYTLGYFLVTHVRRIYGEDAWSRIIKIASWAPIPTLGLFIGAKKVTGKSIRKLYEDTMEEIKEIYESQLEDIEPSDTTIITRSEEKNYKLYNYPVFLSDGTFAALKSDLNHVEQVVRIGKDGSESTILIPGYTDRVSIKQEKIVWSELIGHPRFMSISYSDIFISDLTGENKRALTSKGRYFFPALSEDAGRIAAVHFSLERKSSLVILDTETGEEIKRLPGPEGDFICYPSWSRDGNKLVFVHQGEKGSGISEYDLLSGNMVSVIPSGFEILNNPVFYKEYILYSSSYSGISNIYAIDDSGNRFQVTSGMYGCKTPSVSLEKEQLLFIDYTGLNGESIALLDLKPAEWRPLEKVSRNPTEYFAPVIPQESGTDTFSHENIPNKQYQVKNYNLFMHAIKPHSWGVGINDEDDDFDFWSPSEVSLSIYSNDIMDTTSMALKGSYNINEKTFGTAYDLTLKFLYPEITWSTSLQGRKENSETWNDLFTGVDISLPSMFSRGEDLFSIKPGITSGFSSKIASDWQIDTSSLSLDLKYYMHIGHAVFGVRKNILGFRWLQELGAQFTHSPFYSTEREHHFVNTLNLIFPGFSAADGFQLSGGFEDMEGSYESEILFPRGYDYVSADRTVKGSADYVFPILYPDVAIGPLLYFTRVRGNVFYDYSYLPGERDQNRYSSVGAELTLDFNPLSLPFELNIGVRGSFLIEEHKPVFQFIILGASL